MQGTVGSPGTEQPEVEKLTECGFPVLTNASPHIAVADVASRNPSLS